MTQEGYLRAKANLTQVGVQPYKGYELAAAGFQDLDSNKTYYIYRPESTVFADETKESIKLKPVTWQHPQNDVSADNYKSYSVGTVGEDIQTKDGLLTATLLINDKQVIEDINNGIVGLSLGYDARIEKKSGTYEGKDYDFQFSGPLRVNHAAIVDEGRCGERVRILDTNPKGEDMNKELNKNADSKKDEASVDVNAIVDGVCNALIKDEKFKEELAKTLKTQEVKAQDKAYEEKKTSQEEIDNTVNRKLKVIDTARQLKSDVDINKDERSLIEDSLSDFMSKDELKEKSSDYLLGIMDSMIKNKKKVDNFYHETSMRDSAPMQDIPENINILKLINNKNK